MKKKIVCSTQPDRVTQKFIELLNGDLLHAGYEVRGVGSLPNVRLIVDGGNDPMTPKLSLSVWEDENDTFGVTPTLTFPTLTVDSDSYYDDIEHCMNTWASMGKYISNICKFSFSPYDYEDELD